MSNTKIYVSKLMGDKGCGGEATLRFLLSGKVVHIESFSGMISGKHGGFYRNIKVDAFGSFDTIEEVTEIGVTFEWEFAN